MVTKQIPAQDVSEELIRIIDRHRENLRALRVAHPNPAQELDEFVRAHFDPEVLFELAEDEEALDFDDEALNG